MPGFDERSPFRTPEDDPEFQESFLIGLRAAILHKKFGDLYVDHEILSTRRALESGNGGPLHTRTDEDIAAAFYEAKPLIPEFRELEEALDALGSVEALLEFARVNDLEFTAEEIEGLKETTRKIIQDLGSEDR